jgi:hypothetical protein
VFLQVLVRRGKRLVITRGQDLDLDFGFKEWREAQDVVVVAVRQDYENWQVSEMLLNERCDVPSAFSFGGGGNISADACVGDYED